MMKYPFVRQEGSKECGVATLLMLIKYYNGYINIRYLKELTKTNRNGTTLYNLVKTLREIGFEADGVKCDCDNLINSKINLPFICSVIIDNSYKHFIIVYEISTKWIIVGDPSIGIRKITHKYFKSIYNNALILAKPIKKLPIMSDLKNYNLNKIIKRNKNIILVVVLYSLFITLLSIISSFYFGKLIENIDTSKTLIFSIFIIYFIISFVKYLLEYIKNKIFIFLSKRIDIELTLDIFKSILSLPYKHYKNHTAGDIISRINDLYKLKDFIAKFMICLFIDLPLTTISLFLLLKLNNSLFFISLVILIISSISILIFKKITYYPLIKLKNLQSNDTANMLNSINGFETIKGINIKDIASDKVINNHIKYLNYEESFSNMLIKRDFIKNIVSDLGIIIIDYVGVVLVYEQKITLSVLITFNTILSYFFLSSKNILEIIFSLNDVKASFNRINDIMFSFKETGFLDNFEIGNIKIKDLSYTFDDINYILKNVSLDIKYKEKLLIIGKSGSGKSTLFKIIKGYYKVGYDKISINDIDINNYKNKIIQNNIVYVNQSEILFNDTLLNNININVKDMDKVLDVCKICEIKSIIKNNNLGFNMLVEDNGFNLSNGERQRIVLARSLLSNFEILILDESLNQVDILMERRILKKLFDYYKNKTIIFISHRLNNIDLFDHIVEISKGKIIKNVFRKS